MKQLQEILKNGCEGYTPAVMWFTSGNINKKEMTRQIEGFREQGMKDFFLHPNSDTWGDYLGEYFFDMIRHAVEEAKRLGMNFWIYDEYRWPSGTAGGQVLEEAPWTIGTCLSREVRTVSPKESIEIQLPETKEYDTKVLLSVADGVKMKETTLKWMNDTDHEAIFEVYYISRMLRKSECLEDSEFVNPKTLGYLDTLNPDAVKLFLNKTHEAYKEQVGEGFGEYVKGVFTDEASTMPQPFYETRPEYPWTPEFEKIFADRRGYEIRLRLKDLLDRSDPGLTVDYWETVTELFMEAFMDITQNWCEKNRLIYTGHMLAEEKIDWTISRGGDPYEYYKRLDWPGIDSILTYHFIDNHFYNFPAKRVASAAHFLGKERVLCETFTCSAWDMRLRDMKRAVNRLALLGINFIQFMGAKYDFQPGSASFAVTNNWQNPLFCHYKELSKYISGIQWFVANTEYKASVLLLYPITSGRVTMPLLPPKPDNADSETNLTIDALVNSLLNLNIPFEIGFEQVIEEAQAEDGILRMAGSEYTTVILPRTMYLKEKTFRKLKAFADGGGRILAVNGIPGTVIGKKCYEAPKFKNMVSYECYEYELDPHNARKRGKRGSFTEKLWKALGEDCSCMVEMEPCEGLMSAFRQNDREYYMMLVNDKDTWIRVSGRVNSDLPFCTLSAENGEEKPMEIQKNTFVVSLCPYECVILVISKAASAVLCEKKSKYKELTVFHPHFQIPEMNTARPDAFLVRKEAAESLIRCAKVYNPKKLCDLAESLKEEDLIPCVDRKNIYAATGKSDWYGSFPSDGTKIAPGETIVCVYDFCMDFLPSKLELVSDPQYNVRWYLNSQQLYQTGTKRQWHYANTVFDLDTVAKEGKNRLISICTVPDYQGTFLPPTAALMGDFRFFDDCILTQKAGGNEIDFWNGQGYRCHTGVGIYTAEFVLEKKQCVWLEMETTDVAEVWVNGKYVGKRLWDPYVMELSDCVVVGVNRLEVRVTGTLSNFISNSNPSGLGGVRIYGEE